MARGDKVKKLVVSCIPCNKRVELPIDDATLTFTKRTPSYDTIEDDGVFRELLPGSICTIRVDDFIAYPHIMCKDCLGAADVEVI